MSTWSLLHSPASVYTATHYVGAVTGIESGMVG